MKMTVEEEIRKLRKKNRELEKLVAYLERRLRSMIPFSKHDALTVAARALKAMLLELEWSSNDLHDDYCPVCGGQKHVGHELSCRLKMLIDAEMP